MPSATFASLAISEILALKNPFLANTFVAEMMILLCLSIDFIMEGNRGNQQVNDYSFIYSLGKRLSNILLISSYQEQFRLTILCKLIRLEFSR